MFTPPEIMGRDLSGQIGLPFDRAKAQALLVKAGYPNGQGFPSVKFVSSKGSSNIANAIAGMWQENLKIEVSVEVIDINYVDRLAKGTFDVYILGWLADYNDPDNFLRGVFHSRTEENRNKFSNSEYDGFVERANTLSDPAARQVLYIQAERILCQDQAVIIPLYHFTSKTQ